MIWKTVAMLIVTGTTLRSTRAADPPVPAFPQPLNAAEIQLAFQKLDVLGRDFPDGRFADRGTPVLSALPVPDNRGG